MQFVLCLVQAAALTPDHFFKDNNIDFQYYKTAVLARTATRTGVPAYLFEHLVPRIAARQTGSVTLRVTVHRDFPGHAVILGSCPGVREAY